jgi:two-component SAPR family response regulator
VQIVQDELGWGLVSSGERFDAFGVDDNEVLLVDRMLQAAVTTMTRATGMESTEWRVLVRLMGPITIETHTGDEMTFDKSRSIELLSWIVTHRERPLRSAARTAMWETNVQNATFNNVVSDLRTELQKSMGDSGRVAIDKTFDELLRLDPLVVCDVDVLESAFQTFLREPSIRSRENLAGALSLVRGMPFFGSNFLWPDPEGITSNIVHLIVNAARLLAEEALERGDINQVFFATGQGLKVLHSHEVLIGQRMRAYAREGQYAGVRHEWERYEVAIRNEGGEQDREGAQLMRLRDELLGVTIVK